MEYCTVRMKDDTVMLSTFQIVWTKFPGTNVSVGHILVILITNFEFLC